MSYNISFATRQLAGRRRVVDKGDISELKLKLDAGDETGSNLMVYFSPIDR
ncbi:MAG: hypothetical protein HY381_02240 [Candidatus Chisholmbacteria bacterium]|nr:hypothetical protein [Candidatus Chisholmbacteria bacterium]